MTPPRSRSPALLALTASALAALGGGRAQAQQGADEARVDYRYSAYRESSLPADRVTSGRGERFEVDTQQFRATQPFGDYNSFTADLSYEVMSGASPRFVQPDPSGRPVQVMSGASIRDERKDVLLSLGRNQAHSTSSVSAGYSEERDYRAVNGGLDFAHELDDRVTTLSAGIGYSGDTLFPTQGTVATGTLHDRRDATTAYAGYGRVLDAVTVVQTSLSYTLHRGYLSDPYKQAWIVSALNTVPDSRPSRRGQVAWLTRLRRFFSSTGSTLHADYRYYHDDWNVDAHTVEVSWYQRVGANIQIAPGLRYYSQSQASFYEPYYNQPRADGLASSDYRLSPYGALSASLTASAEIRGWGASLRYERYDSDAGYALGKVVVENPGLVDFQVFSLGLKKVF